MTKNIEWTERYWLPVRKQLELNGSTVPWYAMVWRLREQSPNITYKVAQLVLQQKVAAGELEVVVRGSRRKGRLDYLRLVDRRPRKVTADDLRSLRSLSK